MNTFLLVTASVTAFVVFFGALSFVLKKYGGYAPGWRIRCASCGHHRPAAEAGIVRVAAVGTKHTIAGCVACGKVGHAIIERDPAPAESQRVLPSTESAKPQPGQPSESQHVDLQP